MTRADCGRADRPEQGRAVWLLSGAQGLSQLGDQLSRIALVALIWSGVTPAVDELLKLLAVAAVPSILGAVFAGAIADRYPTRRVLIACDLARGLIVASFPLLYAISGGSTLPIYAAVPVLLAFNRAFRVARGRLLPEWVGYGALGRANALLLGVDRTAEVAGAAAAGLIVVAVGWQAAFILDGVSYLLSGLLLLALPRMRAFERGDEGSSARASGFWADLRSRPMLVGLIWLPALVTLASGAFVVIFLEGLPGRFGTDAPAVTGGLMSAVAAGAVLAALSVRFRDPTRWRLVVSALLIAPVCWILSPVLTVPALIALGVMAGGLASYLLIGSETVIQREASRNVLGRWLALKETAERVLFLVGILAAALLVRSDAVARVVPASAGVALIVSGLVTAILIFRSWLHAGEAAGQILLRVLRFLEAGVRWAPLGPALSLAAWIGRRTTRLHGDEKASVIANQKLAGVSVPMERVLGSYARYHLETAAVSAGRVSWFAARARMDGIDRVIESRTDRTGTIFVTAHLGSWDLAAVLVAGRLGPMAVFAERLRPAALFQHYTAIRERYGVRVLTGASGLREALRILRDGGIVCFLADRPGDGADVTVPFGDGATRIPTGPYRLAAATGAIVFPAVVFRDGNGYLLRIAAPLSPKAGLGAEDQAAVMARAFATTLHGWVKEAPEQWIQFRSMAAGEIPRVVER